MADDQKSFWSSIPGILTGLAALITAAAGLLAAFSHFHSGPSSAPAPSTVSAPASTAPASTSAPASTAAAGSTALPTSIVGSWSGVPNGSRWLALLNIAQASSGFSGTFEDPCHFAGSRPIDVITPEGNGYALTISKLGKHPNGEPFAPIIFNLQLQNGTLLGTYNQGEHHSNVIFSPGRRPCSFERTASQ
jgi:hypothetical protein